MDAVIVMNHSSRNQSMSPYKSHIRNHPYPQRRMINNSLISRPNENLYPSNIIPIHRGLLQTPPHHLFPSHSFPPYYSFPPSPLLLRALSCPPINRKPTNYYRKPRDSNSSSLSPKKTKGGPTPKKDEIKSKKTTTTVTKPSTKDVSKDAPKVLSLSTSTSTSFSDSVGSISVSSVKVIEEGNDNDDDDKMDTFSGSVMYTITAPPPSSLPLPTFSLRPKLSCNAQAQAATTGIDTGATDNLRRLLRLV